MTEAKRIVVTGATGMIGRVLCKQLRAKGYQVVAFSRDPQKARRSVPGAAEYVAWSPAESGPWASAIDGAHGVIHLAGASLFSRRWSPEYKREIVSMIHAWTALESMAARLACARATDAQLRSLRESFPEFFEGQPSEHIDEYSDANIRFHQRIIALGHCEAIADLTSNLLMHVRGIRSTALRQGDRAERSIREHVAIISALEARDAAEHRRFAAAARTEQAADRAAREREGHAAHGLLAFVGVREIRDLKERLHGAF